eukprot:tig00022075_g23606.t1
MARQSKGVKRKGSRRVAEPSREELVDEVDEFHDQRGKVAFVKDAAGDADEDEEQVLDLDLKDSDESDEGEDEGEGEEEEPTGWGRGRRNYYDADNKEDKESDEDAAKEEEEEARRIQKRMMEQLNVEDYGDETLLGSAQQGTAKSTSGKGRAGPHEAEAIKKDLSDLSVDEKLAIIKQEAPELLQLLQEFKEKILSLQTHLQPLLTRVRAGEIPTSKGLSYLEVKFHLLLNYCTNIAFYLLLKANGESVKMHPVISHLVQVRTVLEKLKPLDAKLKYQIDKLLRTAALGGAGSAASDPLRFKPNPQALLSKEEDDGEEGAEKTAVYQPPKLSAVHYDDGDKKLKAKEKQKNKARERARKSSMIRALRDELGELPEEESAVGPVLNDDHQLREEEADRTRYEEENFTRLQLTKEQRRKQKLKSRIDPFADFDDFGDLAELDVAEEQQAAAEQELMRKRSMSQYLSAAEQAKLSKKREVSADADVPRRDLEARRSQAEQASKGRKRSKQDVEFDDSNDEPAQTEDAFYSEMQGAKAAKKQKKADAQAANMKARVPVMEEEEAEGKRGASMQMLKNRGLTPHRSRENKNPRVKHRNKFEKALVKRKGAVRDWKPQSKPYAGESTGIRAGVSRSVSLKQ